MKKLSREALLARYMVGRYRLGYEQVALYLAGVLFEGIINRKLMEHDGWSESDVDSFTLEKKIERLSEKSCTADNLFKDDMRHVFKYFFAPYGPTRGVRELSNNDKQRRKQVKDRLHNFRWVRNKVMHGRFDELSDDGDNKFDDLIHYVWSELAPESFRSAHERWCKRGNSGRVVDVLFEHTADYMIRAIDEVDIKNRDYLIPFDKDYWLIAPWDFDNLFNLRRKMVPLRNHLAEWLKANADFLHTDILTTIDTTSAYIWMPLTRIDNENQTGILTHSVSILATPLDFRLYIDFGGRAAKERQYYFEFLKSEEYKALVSTFVERKHFHVFDTEWYCFISKQQTLGEWLADAENKARIDEALRKVAPLTRDAEIDPITWNRMLHGYIIDKSYFDETGMIDFPMIEGWLQDIIHYFLAFEAYLDARKDP